MNEVYKQTRFRTHVLPNQWPSQFAIITAYATTGQSWADDQNQAANSRLFEELSRNGYWIHPVTGFDPKTGHAEPSWAVTVDFEQACDIGERFLQDAIYYVRDNCLFVSYCKPGSRELVPVDDFIARLD